MKEIILPICVLVVLATLLLPLPPVVLDFLITANLLLALVLLVSTLYITNPLKLSALPSILLLATIYRLALNVSTTRLILSGQHPGDVVTAFGSVVIQGNLVVGLVVFLVITLVQFIVIAKGSERVAEVAARFTLDALPGKQMSIDADIRAGLISAEEAKAKRQDLQLESRFYGALDGAMKFIKGDAIAGLVITAINLIFGLILGMTMLELSFMESINRFTLYTVGDGLISQIPALLNSLAAGIMVTFVGQSGQEASLSSALLNQLGQVKAVKFLVAGLALFLAFAPGLPFFPFLILGFALGLNAMLCKDTHLQNSLPTECGKFIPKPAAPVSFELSPQFAQSFSSSADFGIFMEQLRQSVFDAWGLVLLPPELTKAENSELAYSIKIKGIVAVQQKHSELNEVSLADNFKNTFLNTITNNKLELVDDLMSRRLLDYYEEFAPELISVLIPDIATVTTVTEVLRNLLTEDISIKPFDRIVQALAEHAKGSANTRELTEHVRVALKKHICEDLTLLNKTVALHPLTKAADLLLFKAEKYGAALTDEFLEKLLSECSELADQSCLVASKGSRALLRDCLSVNSKSFKIIAWEELANETNWKVDSYIGLSAQAVFTPEELGERLAA